MNGKAFIIVILIVIVRVDLIVVLIGYSKLTKHPKASTLYLTIPADMAKDSQFDLKHGDRVKLIYKTKVKELIIIKEVKG